MSFRSATHVLKDKLVRDYLVKYPGSTNAEVQAAVGWGTSGLQRVGLARWKRVDGIVRWYAQDGQSRATKPGSDWRWDPDAMRWQRADEVVETKWEAYKP